MADAVIYHNPACSTSRNTLALLRHAGLEPEVIDYQRQPPSRERLAQLIQRAGLGVRDVLRTKGALYTELGLDDPALSEEQLLDVLLKHPILIERPLVETPLGVRLCRPAERVLEILPPLTTPSTKADGKVVGGPTP